MKPCYDLYLCSYPDYSNPNCSETKQILRRITKRIQVIEECLQYIDKKLEVLQQLGICESQPWFSSYLNTKDKLQNKKNAYALLVVGKIRTIYNPLYWVRNKMLNYKLETFIINQNSPDQFFTQSFLKTVEITSDDVEDKNQKIKFLLKEKYSLNIEGHLLRINCLDVSKNQKFIVTGSDDCTVKLWNYDNFDLINTFYKHKRDLTAVLFKSSCLSVLSASSDGRIFFSDLFGNVEEKIKTSLKISCLDLSKNQKFLIIGCFDIYLRILNLSDKSIQAHVLNSDVRSVHLSSSDTKIVFTSCLNVFGVFDLKKFQVLNEVKVLELTSYCACFSSDETFIVSGVTDGRVAIYYIESNYIDYLIGHSKCVLCVDVSNDTNFVASADSDRVIFWNFAQKSIIKNIDIYYNRITCLKFAENSLEIIAGYSESNIFKFFTDDSKDFVESWVFNNTGYKYVISKELDLLVTRTSIISVKERKHYKFRKFGEITTLTKSKSGRFMVLSSWCNFYTCKC